MNGSDRKLVLITGSAGRIGSAVAKCLGDKYQIVGFELMKAIYASENEELVPLDVSSEESVYQAFKHIEAFYGKKIASVIHLAAYYSFENPNYDKYNKITVQGTKNLLKALENFEVEQFIFSSTMLVHKSTKVGEKISEESKLDGNWAYPKSKIETEEIIKKFSKNIPTVVMRIAGVYDDECHSIPISNQIQRIYEKNFIAHFFPGNMDCGASFIHMNDLVNILEKAVDMRKEIPKKVTVLVGEDKALSTRFLQNEISKFLFGKKIWMIRIPKILAWLGSWFLCHIPFVGKPFIRPWMIPLSDENYDLDISKAKTTFHWEPKHKLEDSLQEFCKDLQKNPVHWYEINSLKMPKSLRKIAKSQLREKKNKDKSTCNRKAS